jgi:hypothetical protein
MGPQAEVTALIFDVSFTRTPNIRHSFDGSALPFGANNRHQSFGEN